jgi:hypothetical protein
MLWGAKVGWTTLTANRSSVKAILREIVSNRSDWRSIGKERATNPDAIAAFWVCDPRSLGEQMRSDEDNPD